MAYFNDALAADTADAGQAIHDDFAAGADAENSAKNATMDALVKDWAYWLKYVWGYSGYHASLYAAYDDTIDYSHAGFDNHAYAGADGAYLDLGYQGHNGQTSGLPHQSGFGYGGVQGTDYLYSGDHTGLAYGTNTGPDKKYFSGSVLQPADELAVLLEGYSSTYGRRYW